MADDFIVEEESSNRTFLYAAGGMGAVFIIGLIIVVIMIVTGRNGNDNDEIATQNLTIEAANRHVTETVARMNTVDAYTLTPTPLSTATRTPLPSPTPSPLLPSITPTDVLQTPEPGTGGDSETGTVPEDGGEAAAEGTATTESAVLTPTVGPTGPSGGELPASGMGVWGAIIAAAALVVVIMLARRFRPAA